MAYNARVCNGNKPIKEVFGAAVESYDQCTFSLTPSEVSEHSIVWRSNYDATSEIRKREARAKEIGLLWNTQDWTKYRHLFVSSPRFAFSPEVLIQGYVADSVVLSAFLRPPKGFTPAGFKRRKKVIAQRKVNLDCSTELRRSYRIGGRRRFLKRETRFTNHGRHLVRDAAHIIEEYKKGTGCFLTLTVPSEKPEALAVLGAASGYIVDRMCRWLRYKVEHGEVVAVWELQQRGSPHLHYLFRLPRGNDGRTFVNSVRSEWRKILLDVSAQSGIDVFSRDGGESWRNDKNKPVINLKFIKHSYARYIAKYVSKTRTKDGASSIFRPSRWWSVSKQSRNKIEKRRKKISVGLSDFPACLRLLEILKSKKIESVQTIREVTGSESTLYSGAVLYTRRNAMPKVVEVLRFFANLLSQEGLLCHFANNN